METNQTVKNFLMKLAEDEELRGKFEAATKRQDGAECAALIKAAGFNFNQADLDYLAELASAYESGELNEAQLEMVSGGFTILGLVLVLAWAGVAAAIKLSIK